MVRVWFNHWFSTSYRLIGLMKEDGKEEICVIGSNLRRNSVIQNACDEWYEEPDLSGDAYINFCVDFCKTHNIDVFVPRRQMEEISRNRKRFYEAGVRVMVDDIDHISFLNDKAAAYRFFCTVSGIHVPEYHIVNNISSFRMAYAKLKENNDRICIKFVRDEGGKSFRRVVEHVDRFASLRAYNGAGIVLEDLASILSERETFDDLMVMPYLPGDEISVDCLSTVDGLIAVARVKGPFRDEKVVFDETILTMCRAVLKKIPLENPCNIQFKMKDDIPYFLEINTRMSGGLPMSCLAAGVNIPNIALNKLMGRSIPWNIDRREKTVSYIELPQIINGCVKE